MTNEFKRSHATVADVLVQNRRPSEIPPRYRGRIIVSDSFVYLCLSFLSHFTWLFVSRKRLE